MTEAEKYYNDVVGPKLLELAKECEEHGLSILVVCEWGPNQHERTLGLQAGSGFGIRLANSAAQSNGNVDSLWVAIQRHARENGHNSVFLEQQGIPCEPLQAGGGLN